MPINDIAPDSSPGPEGESYKFEAIGDMVTGTVVHFGKFVSDNRFNPGRRDEVLVISLEQADGSVLKIWPVTKNDVDNDAYPDRMSRAIVAAIRVAGKDALSVGSTLAVRYSESIETKFGNPAKGFQAEYKPHVEIVAADDDDGAVTGLIS